MIDIVFPVFNLQEVSDRGLDSLRSNAGTDDYRVIFVDNGSTDGTQEWVQEAKRSDDLYIRNEENLYITRAWNQGLEASSAEYVVIVNNDLEFSDNWIPNLIKPIEQFPAQVLVSTAVTYDDREAWKDSAQHHECVWGFNLTLTRFIGNCFCLSRQCINEIGKFDERFRLHWQDIDYAYRLFQAREWPWDPVALALNVAVYHMGAATQKIVEGRDQIHVEDEMEFKAKWHERRLVG